MHLNFDISFCVSGKTNGVGYEDLVQQQQELIDYLTTGQVDSSERPIPEDSYFLEEKAELEKAKSDFKNQKHAFEKVRKANSFMHRFRVCCSNLRWS